MFNVHKKFNLQLQCIRIIVNFIKINFCLKCMGHTNIYHGMNYYIASSREKKRETKKFDPLFLVCMITLPLAQPRITIQFPIILGSLSHKNPSLNIDVPIIFILLISYNIIFGPSHPHRINFRVCMPHKNKIINKQVMKRRACNSAQRRPHALNHNMEGWQDFECQHLQW